MYAQAKIVIMARPENTINRSLWNRFAISKLFHHHFFHLCHCTIQENLEYRAWVPFMEKDVSTVIASGFPGSNDLMRGVDHIEHVIDRYLFVSVLTLDIFNWSYRRCRRPTSASFVPDPRNGWADSGWDGVFRRTG